MPIVIFCFACTGVLAIVLAERLDSCELALAKSKAEIQMLKQPRDSRGRFRKG